MPEKPGLFIGSAEMSDACLRIIISGVFSAQAHISAVDFPILGLPKS
jgi:hypothetical protein